MPTFERFNLPDAGEGLTEAEIVTWHVGVGDTVTQNQMIVEIETAKSLVELPSPHAGVVTEILHVVGTVVEVGQPIIVIDTDPTGAPIERSGAASTVGEVAEEGSGAVLVGYGVAAGASARRVRTTPTPTPEATPAPFPASGQSVPPVAPQVLKSASAAAEPVRAVSGQSADCGTIAQIAPRPGSLAVRAKPPVRKLARDLGVDLSSIAATGPGGIATREDVLAYSVQAQPRGLATYVDDDAPWLASGQVSSDGRQTRVPVKSVRKRTAEAMVTSAFTAPHVTVFQTVDVTKTMRLVDRLRKDREFVDVRVTPLLVMAKALLIAVNRQPEINASWDEGAQEIVYKHYVNLGIAASTPRGLVVPNIKDAHRLGLKGLAQAIADLTATARAGKTSTADMSDGTITITNVGVFGIDTGTPILNPGEAAILAFGAIREQPWVHKGKIKKRLVTQLALSFDHRLVDGALGSRLLADVAAIMADPAQALVWS